MGKSIPVTINGLVFSTKTALTAHMRDLISRYSVGCDVDSADQAFCLALFKFHPDANLKLASGIARIEIRLDEYGKKHFHLHRMDGTDDDISWPWCIRHAS